MTCNGQIGVLLASATVDVVPDGVCKVQLVEGTGKGLKSSDRFEKVGLVIRVINQA